MDVSTHSGAAFDLPAAQTTSGSLSTFDPVGRPIQLTAAEIRKRNLIALAALEVVEQIGNAAEQRETLDYLRRAVDQDRLSEGRRFTP
ncbi:MAG TPA: hypothetical protein VF278_25045 [Pirellulales bacterium]